MIVLVILAVWFLVAVPVALLVGGAVRLRDRDAPESGSRSGRKAA